MSGFAGIVSADGGTPDAKLIGARLAWCQAFFLCTCRRPVVFSNTLEAVRVAPDVSATLDLYFIGDFLLQSWCPDAEGTAFLDIRRLPAGHALKHSNGELRVSRYATLPIEEPLFLKRREEYVEEFRGHLERAVCNRFPAGPAACFMSGGLDSTSVAAMATRVQVRRGIRDSLRAYTVDYTPLFEDEEGAFATKVAQHLGIPIDILAGASTPPFGGWEVFTTIQGRCSWRSEPT
jgi:asparagine synthase (glutamine-hydrolysing)